MANVTYFAWPCRIDMHESRIEQLEAELSIARHTPTRGLPKHTTSPRARRNEQLVFIAVLLVLYLLLSLKKARRRLIALSGKATTAGHRHCKARAAATNVWY